MLNSYIGKEDYFLSLLQEYLDEFKVEYASITDEHKEHPSKLHEIALRTGRTELARILADDKARNEALNKIRSEKSTN